jgi:hypothetical protein
METRRLKVVANTGGTGGCPDGGTCPTVYLNERGEYVVQGLKIDRATRAEISERAGGAFPDGEDAVVIPAHIVAQLRGGVDV